MDDFDISKGPYQEFDKVTEEIIADAINKIAHHIPTPSVYLLEIKENEITVSEVDLKPIKSQTEYEEESRGL